MGTTLKYKVITTKEQYFKYCNILEKLVCDTGHTKQTQDEIDLLTLLIETWDNEHSTLKELDPVQLLKSLMKEHKLKAVGISNLLDLSEGLVSDILHYKKGFSKHSIRVLAEYFKVSQEAFNRHYKLKTQTELV
ncbi:MAG TPA: transcriptional regulator [Bacteroidia bacterium]|jgi:HTH-type transcriptional regulator/antitoxin HigA|nr:transcriptional regulator [Bacteroidia bacterium]